MRVVCKNVSEIGTLTIDKIYDVLSTNLTQYLIEDDSGNQRWYNTSRFEDLSTIRQDKLKQLGI
jgi:hypothetical protein